MSFEPAGDIFHIDDSPREASFENLGFDPATTARINTARATIPSSTREADPVEERLTEFFRERFERRHETARMSGEHLPKLVFACLPLGIGFRVLIAMAFLIV